MDQPQPPTATGAAAPPPLPPRIAPSAAQPLAPPPAAPPPRSKGRRWGCLVGVIVALICVAVGGVSLLSGVLSGFTSAMLSGVLSSEDPDRRVIEETVSGGGLGTDRKIVVIDVKGIIMSEDAFDMAGSRRIAHELAAARRDPHVVAIILDMDTPGGEVTASDEIYREVRLCSQANTPVVTCMHSVAASGGYFVAAGSDWIIANRLTITGSIGVIIGTLNYSALLTKIGVESEVYKSGQMKDMLRGSRPRTDMERAYVQGLVDETYREFATIVANGRTQYDTAEDVIASEFGDGRILSGADALRLGLVDQLGYFEDAVAKAKELAGVPVAKVVRYRRPLRFTDLLLGMRADARLGLQSLLPAEARAIRPGRLYFLMPSALE